MKKKNILGLTVLSLLTVGAGLSCLGSASADSAGVHAAAEASSSVPDGWSVQGANESNTVSAYVDSDQGNSILLKRNSAEGALKARSSLTSVKGNTYYNFSVSAKTTGASQLLISVVEYKDGKTALKSTDVIKLSTVTDAWVKRPGMIKTSAEANGIVVEIQALGTGEVYASKLFIHEGVAPSGVMTGRTKYFEGPAANPDSVFSNLNANLKDITPEVLSSDSTSGYSALKLTPGRGVYLQFDDYKITGKFILRFNYRYVGDDTNAEMIIKLDGVNKAGTRVWDADRPKAGWTPHGLWDSFEYEFSAQAGVVEPIFVAPYVRLKSGSSSSTGYYLIDDLQVLDEKGNNIVENGDFELKENSPVNTIGYADFLDGVNEANWATSVFGHIPSSAYVDEGYENTRSLHLDARKSLGISLPIVPSDQYTLSFKYRAGSDAIANVRMDGYDLDGKQFYYAPISVKNTNGEWDTASCDFRISNGTSAVTLEYLVLNAVSAMDVDSISLKDSKGNEFIYGGSFDPLMAGGASYLGNAGVYTDDQGNIVYSSMKNLNSQHGDTVDSMITLSLPALGMDVAKADVPYTISFEYRGGNSGSAAGVTDRNLSVLAEQSSSADWKKVEATFKTTMVGGFNNQEIRIYGNHYNVRNCYIRNISLKDADGNEYAHPLADGASILPQGSFRLESVEDKKSVDEFVAKYITAQGSEDYTQIDEANRTNQCRAKLNAALGAYKRLTDSQKQMFENSGEYAEARAVLDMWRTVSTTSSLGKLSRGADSNSSNALVCTVLALGAVALAAPAIYFARRKSRDGR